MQKRVDAYNKNPDLLAMRNAQEQLLGSGIKMGVDKSGQLTISNEGSLAATGSQQKQQGGVAEPAFGAGNKQVQFAMQSGVSEANAIHGRANAIRQG